MYTFLRNTTSFLFFILCTPKYFHTLSQTKCHFDLEFETKQTKTMISTHDEKMLYLTNSKSNKKSENYFGVSKIIIRQRFATIANSSSGLVAIVMCNVFR